MHGIFRKSILIPIAIAAIALISLYSITRHLMPKNAFDPFIIAKTMMQEPPEIPGPGDGPNVWGPFTGIVLDAETEKPIPKVQIYLYLKVANEESIMYDRGGCHHSAYTQTNSKGYYKIRQYRFSQSCIEAYPLTFIAYKAGYVAYNNDVIFKDGLRTDFKIKNNVILLEKWDDTKFTMQDHVEHVQKMLGTNCRDIKVPGAIRFCKEKREEMILECMYYNPKNPTPKSLCVKGVDEMINRKR